MTARRTPHSPDSPDSTNWPDSPDAAALTIVGAGPVGCVLALVLARRGYRCNMIEKRPDLRASPEAAGRSINLVLTDRGLRALRMVGLGERILDITVEVYGRMIHSAGHKPTFQPYGKDRSECNYSVSRDKLNAYLLDAVEAAGVDIDFQTSCVGADFQAGTLDIRDERHGRRRQIDAPVVLGADGAPSAIRTAMVDADITDQRVDMLGHGYKEMVFPAAANGQPAMDGQSLHIWPRGDHFLMGLANLDGSFTGTVYLPWNGPSGFGALDDAARVRAFFEEHYASAIPLLDDNFAQQFVDRPDGTLGTVRCAPWHHQHRVLLLGDAAHGIVPFFGQGLNCGFEDCVVLDGVLDEQEPAGRPDLTEVFAEFSRRRKPDTDAIADMALDNFDEMRSKVADPQFLLAKAVEQRLEEELTDRYRSRYAMVMYSHIPYRAALAAGEVQHEILAELTANIDHPDQVDIDHARQLIDAQLGPVYDRHDVDLSF